jgi:hypothetical protein
MNETKSALPAKIRGTEITRFNALCHGVLSRYTVLPWAGVVTLRATSTRSFSAAGKVRPLRPRCATRPSPPHEAPGGLGLK